ncbi:hypothetical protein [Paracoccus sediminicola]|uniref:hypothetical protein n=1 Tax=Paracoccus sediminicola TaxID=3017783 RepID=UPI0022F13DC2|nr:hypothetical protein [Paracoccus sediminicola]WBU58096.1 hypothetical protein PAF18_06640 [Paracoccus sediminicola]
MRNSKPDLLPIAALILVAGMAGLPATAQQGAPLSSNDWLRSGGASGAQSSSAWRPGDPVPPDASRRRPVSRPPTEGGAQDGPADVADGTAVADSAATVPVGVRRLSAADPDGAGIISARQAGLPQSFWSGTDLETALRMIRAEPALPASAQIARRILEAQLAAPASPSEDRIGAFFAARVDQLIASGALPSARDLLQGAGQDSPATFHRLFELSLLLGGETGTCARMARAPGIVDDPAARIFCLAQSGDWPAAALLLTGAERLNMIDAQLSTLLTHYLDDTRVESGETLPVPEQMSPLAFRLHEAIGQPLPTGDLDLRYAWTDLDNRAGWKAQLEAAERLSRARALPAARLFQLYTAQRPAASGGVWERAAAVQGLDAALIGGDPARIGAALQDAYREMARAGLRDAFAAIFAERLDPQALSGEAARLALWLRLWEGETEVMAAPENELDAAILALASGGQPESLSPALAAMAPIFADDLPPEPQLDTGMALAPALYGALADADAGIQGDVTRAARGVRLLRELGLIADARRVATQIALDPLLTEAAE